MRYYFEHHFAHEGKQTIGALRARMESLFASEGVKLALAGSTAPDFCELQNKGRITLVNCGGPNITRGVRLLLQSLVASDIRQAVFARPNEPPVTYFWCIDEAQNLFATRQQQNDVYDLLTMGRSFGSFFYFLCQNLSASADGRLLQQLYTNMRWSLTLRGTPQDGSFLRSVLPVTGRQMRPDPHPFHERTYYSLEEERSLLLDSIAHLPDRTGFYWPKTRSGEAIKLRTARLELPSREAFQEAVRALREESTFGGRVPREDYDRQIRERDRQWLGSSPVNDSPDDAPTVQDRWEQVYRSQEKLWRR